MIQRRNFLSLAAAAVPIAAAGLPREAFAQRAGTNACPPDLAKIKTRMAAPTEVLYRTPHGNPNGLALSSKPDELWVLDQGSEGWVSLTRLADGSVIREFRCDLVAASGIVIDDNNVMWVTSTHNSLIVSIDPANGRTIAKYVTPGAGRIYKKKGDPAQRSTALKPAYPRPPAAGAAAARGPQLPPGQMPLDSEEGAGGTGAHGILSKGDYLIYVCPPSRAIFVTHQKTWEVQDVWPTPGNRPHGITWVDASKTSFWNVDSNLNTFYRYDASNGAILEAVTVREEPHTVCHGAKLIGNYMYFCDDVGWLCRIKWV